MKPLTEAEKLIRTREALRDAVGMLSAVAVGKRYVPAAYLEAIEQFRKVIADSQ